MTKELDPTSEFARIARESAEIGGEMMREFNEIDRVQISYDSFIRTGLPIIHGIIRGEIHHGAWLQFIGGINQTADIIKDDQVFMVIPEVLASVPTNVFQDVEAPTFHSFVSELNLNRQDSPEMWEVAVTNRLGNSFADMQPNLQFFHKINELFKDNGLTEIVPEDFVTLPEQTVDNARDVGEVIEHKPEEVQEAPGNAIDEGDLL